MTTGEPILRIIDLWKTFHPGTPNEVRALQGISCEIQAGSFVILVGTNGSGKSTLLNAVAGTFLPDSGKILFKQKDITHKPEHKRALHFGRVFQNPFSGTAPDMTVSENLSLAAKKGSPRGLGLALNARSRSLFRERIKSLNMEMEDRLQTPIGKLSGGQRQAITLLMASWVKPDILLLDEHTAALDPKTASKVVQLTREIVEKDHLTTLMVTHSMQQAILLGDRILMLHRGKIVKDITGEEKKNLKVNDLMAFFDEIRKKDLIDPSLAEMFRQNYL
ncbi:MAG TPA: ATP-binding cassette domain-containing protein [Bacteroidales bacterium]|nr:ATP-binding cassette domain-containing protein [Bacteroidales bacterium]HNS46641.1 ATP-binding cassette domain-containing protein [Bacteroidales bacterium]